MDPDFLQEALHRRTEENALRKLKTGSLPVDLCSNDYLGFSRSESLYQGIKKEAIAPGWQRNGSTGSRLLTGNTQYAEKLEQKLAEFHRAESALLFNSGYDANLGLLSSIARREDCFVYDSLSHASIIDGIRLSRAEKKYKFEHNNIEDLEKKLRLATGNVFVVVESLYSMDGDIAPLHKISRLCQQYGAYLIVDEAHANGIFGPQGRGIAVSEKLETAIFARVLTFGKALGVHGAVIAGSSTLRNYLINFSRSFIYTTALPFHALVAIDASYDLLNSADAERKTLFDNIHFFNDAIKQSGLPGDAMQGPIQSIVVPGNDAVKKTALLLQSRGFDIRAILSPTVEKGKERLRVCIHSFNTKEQLQEIINILKEIR